MEYTPYKEKMNAMRAERDARIIEAFDLTKADFSTAIECYLAIATAVGCGLNTVINTLKANKRIRGRKPARKKK